MTLFFHYSSRFIWFFHQKFMWPFLYYWRLPYMESKLLLAFKFKNSLRYYSCLHLCRYNTIKKCQGQKFFNAWIILWWTRKTFNMKVLKCWKFSTVISSSVYYIMAYIDFVLEFLTFCRRNVFAWKKCFRSLKWTQLTIYSSNMDTIQ